MKRLPSPGKNNISCSLQTASLHDRSSRLQRRKDCGAERGGKSVPAENTVGLLSCSGGGRHPKSAGTQLLTDNRGRVRGKDEQVSNSNPQAVAEISRNHTQQPSLCKFL